MSNNYFNRASGLLQQDWSNASLLLAQSCQHTSASRFDAIASKTLAGPFPRAYDVSRPRPRQVPTDLPNCPLLTFGCAHDDEMPLPAEPDTALLFLGSFFEDLHHAPVRDDAKLDALAMQILDKGPKTLLGLVIRARAEKWLRRDLWTLAFDSLSPLEQGVRVVIDSAMRIDCGDPGSRRGTDGCLTPIK